MNKTKNIKKLKAFTLMEILVVLAIISVMMLLVLPSQASVVSKAKATEAKSHLKQIYALQKAYFTENSRYSNSFEDIGYTEEATVNEGGGTNYSYEIIESSTNSFSARATAVVDFNGNGQFNVWEIDHKGKVKEVTKD